MNKTARIVIVLVVFTLVVAAAALAVVYVGRTTIEQPIAFNHMLHVDELGLDCTDCHLYAESGVRATIPNLEVCSDCHEEATTDSPEEAKLVEHIASGEKIPWQKVYRVPEHVYFSHRRHTAIAGLDCEVCHGVMRERVEPVTRPAVRMTMDHCMDCHYEKGVSNDCLLCHR